MKPTTIVFSAVVGTLQILGVSAASHVVGRQATTTTPVGVQHPSERPLPGNSRSQGCFTSSANMTSRSVQFLSSGSCHIECRDNDFWVMALHGEDCLCGFVYPPRDTRTDDEDCNYPCPYFDQEACGALDPSAYSVFNTGVRIDVAYAEPEESSTTSSAPTSTGAPTSTASTETSASSVPTRDPSNSDGQGDDNNEDSGPNVAAIAAGVVGGLVAVAAVAGGFWFHMRRKRNAEIEEEHRRNAAVNAFISGAKPPSSSGISITDSRLEPGFGTRRLSDGSIADNQDYSRKILRVTNA